MPRLILFKPKNLKPLVQNPKVVLKLVFMVLLEYTFTIILHKHQLKAMLKMDRR